VWRLIRQTFLKTEMKTKLKAALALSIVINVVCLAAVGYMDATTVAPESTPPLIVYVTNGPTAVGVVQSLAQR
jgi:hypothetical protein